MPYPAPAVRPPDRAAGGASLAATVLTAYVEGKIANSREFTLVPWRPVLIEAIDRLGERVVPRVKPEDICGRPPACKVFEMLERIACSHLSGFETVA